MMGHRTKRLLFLGAEEEIRTPDPLLGNWDPALQAATELTTPIRSMQAANN